jgi:hypothetical protein
VRLYRVTKTNPPTAEDMKSHWDLGKRPPRHGSEAAYQRSVEAYQEVSTFETASAAAAKARTRGLGQYIAELDVPESAIASRTPSSSHVGLAGLTPPQLLESVLRVHSVDDA